MFHRNKSEAPPVRGSHSPFATASPGGDALLQYYLGLPAKERDKQFINTASAAESIGCSQRTIQRWIEEGKVRAVFIAGRDFILISSLNDFVQRESDKHT